jgi:hypothetical protein
VPIAQRGHCLEVVAHIGVEAVLGQDPEVAFGGDPAGEISVGGHDRVHAEAGELSALLIGQ